MLFVEFNSCASRGTATLGLKAHVRAVYCLHKPTTTSPRMDLSLKARQ